MTTTVVQTAPPTDVFNSGVGGAPLITQAGVNVDNTLLSAVQAAAAANGVTLIVGGVGGSPTPPGSFVPLPSGAAAIGKVPTVTAVSPLALDWETPAGGGGGGAVASVAGKTGAVTLVKGDVGLGNVDNTADASKPVSTAQATANTAATAAAQATSLQKTSNLSDLANAGTARTNLGLGTAATQASTAFDASGAAAALSLTDIATTATTNGALTIGKHNPVDATSGARTMTLANAASAGQLVSFEKTDSTVNAVAVTLNLRGTPASTFTLVWQSEAILLVGKADGSWWPVAGHKTKAALDTAYGSPISTTIATSGASQTLTLPAATDIAYDVTLTANCAFALAGGTAGKFGTITVILRQDATAGRTVTLPSNVAWPGQTPPTFNVSAGKYDVLQLATVDAGTTWIASLVASQVQPITVPQAPVSLSVNPSSTQNVLTWADAGNGGLPITNHKVYRDGSLVTTLGSVLTYTDTGRTNGTSYSYTVSAVNSLGEGPQSAALPSIPGHYLAVTTGGMSTPWIAGFQPSAQTIDLRARIQMASWVPAGNVFVINSWGATAANNRYALYIDNAGKLNGAWYNPAGVFQSVASSVATNVPANGAKWIRALMDPNAGTCTYYLSDDGSTWTQLGTQITGLTSTGLMTTGTPYALTAGQTASATGQFAGKILRAQLLIGGTTVANADVTTQTPSAGTFTDGQGLTWTVASPAVIT